MRLRTVVVLVGLCAALGAAVFLGLGSSAGSGAFAEAWVSDTPRNNSVNHHAVGVGPAGDVVVAPVAEVPGAGTPITNTSCALTRLAPVDGATNWRTGMPPEDCFTHALTEPAIRDVDGDGSLEVVVSSTEDALVAYGAADGREEWRVPLSSYGYGRPTVADVRPAAGPEIVTSDIDGVVVLAHGNGTVAWRADLNRTVAQRPTVWAAPIVRDFDADGAPEILLGTNSGPVILAADGSVEWYRQSRSEYTAAAQVDDDPAIEVFTSGTPAVRAFDGATGEQEWRRAVSNARIRTATDVDGDGTVELYAGVVGGDVLALEADSGATEWRTAVTTTDDATVNPPVLADLSGDGSAELVAALDSGTVVALDATDGSELSAYEREVPVWTFPTTGDIDDDSRAEVLVRYGDGRVVALDWTTGAGNAD
ncbi:outer membrane protein assembly factor BamB family protein [Halorientalis marina]|uniref:outer membrane protein assembly factor BamB family protein n=1 Tax=Halorientalis marina TaxID=2931976 RepID=UPI001FF17F30|nr:PQQ-binding-like beta-propeller repeat protein [Halorientalis marina]